MELLSPAGNLKHIDLAIEKKVDAVYGGLKEWNARNKVKQLRKAKTLGLGADTGETLQNIDQINVFGAGSTGRRAFYRSN